MLPSLTPAEFYRYALDLLFAYLEEEDDNQNIVLADKEISVTLLRQGKECRLRVHFLQKRAPLTRSESSYLFIGEGHFEVLESGVVLGITLQEPLDPPDLEPIVRKKIAHQVLCLALDAFSRDYAGYFEPQLKALYEQRNKPTSRLS